MAGRADHPTLPAEPLVGRRRELAVVARALDTMSAGRFQVLELVGEPGVGKTRLLDELAAEARGRRYLTLAGRATEFEQDLPLAPVVDALDDELSLQPGVLDALGPEGRYLADVFPGLRKSGSAPDLAGGPAADAAGAAARYRFHRAVRSLLALLARPAGLVLLLDDVHWADPASLDLLDHLLRHPPAGPVVLALAYRPLQVPARLASVTAALPAERVRRLELAPLTRVEAAQLLGTDLEPARQDHLYRLSGGNPLYLHALRHSAARPGTGRRAPDDPDFDVDPATLDGTVPAAVLAALTAEVEAVPAAARPVALGAAVAGNEFDPALVVAVTGSPPDLVLAALDDLAARDLVRAVPGTGRFRFRHPLVRHVTYTAAGAGWRVAAHGRAAAALRRAGASPEVQAHHVAAAASLGDLDAVRTLVAAARAVAPQAPATAVAWLRAALRILPVGETHPDPAGSAVPSRLDLLSELANCQEMGGDLPESQDTLRTVLRLLPPGDHARRAATVGRAAGLGRLLGEHAESQALLRGELARQPDSGSAPAGHLALQLAMYTLLQGDFATAHGLLDRVAATGVEGAAAPVIAAGLRAFTAGPAGAGVAAFPAAAAALIDAAPDATVAAQIDTFAWLCWTELYLGHHANALRHFTRFARVASEAGIARVLPYLLAGRASARGWLGELGEATAAAEEAVAAARMLGAAEPLAAALAAQSWVLCRAGQAQEAVEVARQAVAAGDASQSTGMVMARTALALAQMAAGAVDAAHLDLLDSCGGPDMPFLSMANRLTGFTLLAEADAARGDAAQARSWSERADRCAVTGTELETGLVGLVRAYALSTESPAEAARCATAAAQALDRAGVRSEAGRARLLVGSCLAATGQRAAALAELRAAAEILSRCGASRLHAQAARLQRQLGARVPGSAGTGPRTGPLGLSRREAQVAALLCAGRTNQEIADQLVLSVRTVETHLSHIYTKLEVTSRAAAATVLAREL